MSAAPYNDSFASVSSSSQAATPNSADDRDELDLLGHDDDVAVLDDDPIHGNLNAPLSFKRRQEPSILSAPARLLSAFPGLRSARRDHSRSESRGSTSSVVYHGNDGSPRNNNSTFNVSAKDGVSLDWYTEGPGRRVGYEDLTAIDWIFEYTKERQRLRVLASSASGLMGYIQHLLDASQVWIILLLTGMAVGAVAAWIDVTTDWLGDLKLGFCSSGPEGGHFYLNKNFCCMGYDQGSHCVGWKSWGEAMGVSAAGGRWFIGYFFFISLSVWRRKHFTWVRY